MEFIVTIRLSPLVGAFPVGASVVSLRIPRWKVIKIKRCPVQPLPGIIDILVSQPNFLVPSKIRSEKSKHTLREKNLHTSDSHSFGEKITTGAAKTDCALSKSNYVKAYLHLVTSKCYGGTRTPKYPITFRFENVGKKYQVKIS